MKKIIIVFIACLFSFFIVLPDSGHAGPEYSHLWVRVLNVYYYPISNAEVFARCTKYGYYHRLTFRGWGYYNDTLAPGTYDIIVNGRVLKRGVYASAFWYVIVTCYI